jgi:hypothetical protein
MEKVPPPKEPRPKVPEKPKEKLTAPPEKKPSLFGERGWVETKMLSQELKKEEYFEKLGLPLEKRKKIGEILGDKKIFGEIIEKGEIGKIQALIRELKDPGSSSFSEIREMAKKVRQEIGEYKAKTLAEILREKFGL